MDRPQPADDLQNAFHAPVLAHEVRELLGNARHVLDGTLGGGGHALALLEAGAHVTACDRDPAAIQAASTRLAPYLAAGQLAVHAANYADLDAVLPRETRFDGIVLDLGVSSRQLDEDGRGFTFRPGAPLDMRMEGRAATGGTAADYLNQRSERELEQMFREFGDEPRARRLAREVIRRRDARPFATSDDLVNAIRAALGPSTGPADFARLFQAVRIAVNGELQALEGALPRLRDRLTPGGTLAVIAYHSGEDRIVKRAFQDWSRSCVCPPRQPFCTCRGRALGTSHPRRPIVAAPDEVARNPRARSARLRAWHRAP
jgi:16S rRNA (cytosine1402-N4)-methyltransferase